MKSERNFRRGGACDSEGRQTRRPGARAGLPTQPGAPAAWRVRQTPRAGGVGRRRGPGSRVRPGREARRACAARPKWGLRACKAIHQGPETPAGTHRAPHGRSDSIPPDPDRLQTAPAPSTGPPEGDSVSPGDAEGAWPGRGPGGAVGLWWRPGGALEGPSEAPPRRSPPNAVERAPRGSAS